MALYPPWFFDNTSLDTGLIINPADDQNAPIGIVAYYTSPGLLLLFYIKIETLPVYLKKEERIEALCMIMVLSLLIYSFAEWRLRERLKETGQTIPNQLNKPTQRPTMRWVFEIFMGVIQAIVTSDGKVIKISVNLNSTQVTILRLLGHGCENYYGRA